jgi:hypothetical protein
VQRPEVGVLSLIDSRLRNPVLYRGLLRGVSLDGRAAAGQVNGNSTLWRSEPVVARRCGGARMPRVIIRDQEANLVAA